VHKRREPQHSKKKNRALEGNPQARGIIQSLTVLKPKKPNSSNKFIVKVLLQRSQKLVTAYEPGEGHGVQQHGIVLVRGGPVQDLVGCRYKVVRGAKGYDSQPPFEVNGESGAVRQQARSKYGQTKHDAAASAGMDPGQRDRHGGAAPAKKKK
jgi:small subunit ribosomal protein S12